MPSTFTWLDYSEKDRRQMVDVIDQFSEQDTRDELGIGSVRDAFADLLFPGTSTIQTRARYFLFIPWIYREIESRRIPSSKIASRARSAEIDLINALAESEDPNGTIGIQARDSLQRLPSNIYWQGLGKWGIRIYQGTQAQYQRFVDTYYDYANNRPRRDDGDLIDSKIRANWHSGLPDPPDGFPQQASFRFTKVEAEYLQERILSHATGTLLAFLAGQGEGCEPCTFPWENPQRSLFPKQIQDILFHARIFSEVVFGAALLYNLMLAEKSDRDDLAERYRVELHDWVVACVGRQSDLKKWDPSHFWATASPAHVRIPLSTKNFVNEWFSLALPPTNAAKIADYTTARELIHNRERHLKKGLARLDNSRALELWNGESGAFQLDYRWGTTQTILNDLFLGLRGKNNA